MHRAAIRGCVTAYQTLRYDDAVRNQESLFGGGGLSQVDTITAERYSPHWINWVDRQDQQERHTRPPQKHNIGNCHTHWVQESCTQCVYPVYAQLCHNCAYMIELQR
jgi:hypothetical protein